MILARKTQKHEEQYETTVENGQPITRANHDPRYTLLKKCGRTLEFVLLLKVPVKKLDAFESLTISIGRLAANFGRQAQWGCF